MIIGSIIKVGEQPTFFLYQKTIMAKIEVNKYLGSSQDNFLVFSNSDYERPYVTFYFTSGGNPLGTIKINDALDEDGMRSRLGGRAHAHAQRGRPRGGSRDMVFPVVMYICESWTIKKAKCRRMDSFKLWCWRDRKSVV